MRERADARTLSLVSCTDRSASEHARELAAYSVECCGVAEDAYVMASVSICSRRRRRRHSSSLDAVASGSLARGLLDEACATREQDAQTRTPQAESIRTRTHETCQVSNNNVRRTTRPSDVVDDRVPSSRATCASFVLACRSEWSARACVRVQVYERSYTRARELVRVRSLVRPSERAPLRSSSSSSSVAREAAARAGA